MANTMRGLVKEASRPGKLVYRTDLPIPEPGDDEVLIKVHCSAICGTDMHIVEWDKWSQIHAKAPLVIGHETQRGRGSIGREDTKDISFTVHKKDLDEAKEILEENKESLRFDHIETDSHIGKVSIVGAGLMTNCGMAARMFEALYEAGINIQMINTSEIRVSVLLDEHDVDRAVRAIHAKFFDEA